MVCPVRKNGVPPRSGFLQGRGHDAEVDEDGIVGSS